MPLEPETILQNRYRIVRPLGQGGMGTVYEAIDERLDTTVALKESHFTDERLSKQFEREARLMARLRHPAMTKVIDHFNEGQGQFLVMEFITGEDLWETLERRDRAFPFDEVIVWAEQLLDLLDYLHTQEPPIIHRDIKPKNLKLTGRGQIILLDFGLAKGYTGHKSRISTSGSIFGYTPHYAPLEQIQGQTTDTRSDIYSLGATLWHLLTRERPPDVLTRVNDTMNGEPDPLKAADELNHDVPFETAAILNKAMALSSNHRFSSAAEMRQALRTASRTIKPKASPAPPHLKLTLSGHGAAVNAVAFSPDGESLASGSYDKKIILWDVATGKMKLTLEGHEFGVTSVTFFPDGQTLLSGSYDKTLKLWNTITGALKRTLVWYQNPSIDTIALSSNGRLGASGGQMRQAFLPVTDDAGVNISAKAWGEVTLWDASTLESLASFQQSDVVESLSFSPDGLTLASGSRDKTINLWDTKTGQIKQTFTETTAVTAVAFAPDGNTLASGSWDNTIKLWDIQTGRIKATLEGHSDAINCLAFSPDGGILASGSSDSSVRLWDNRTGESRQVLKWHASQVSSVAFSPDSNLLASASYDKTVNLWDISGLH